MATLPGLPPLRFELAALSRVVPVEVSADTQLGLICQLVKYNARLLRATRLPALYESGVRYRRDPPGEELYSDAWYCLQRGYADCKKLVAWRCAELAIAGELATPLIQWRVMPDGQRRFHVVVHRASGVLEDPSRLLGMED